MKVVRLVPGGKAEIVDIENSLKSLQHEVNGYIEAIYLFEDKVALICNEEGKIAGEEPCLGLIFNGELYDIIFGTVIIVGLSEDNFESLSDDLADKYCNMINTTAKKVSISNRFLPAIEVS